MQRDAREKSVHGSNLLQVPMLLWKVSTWVCHEDYWIRMPSPAQFSLDVEWTLQVMSQVAQGWVNFGASNAEAFQTGRRPWSICEL